MTCCMKSLILILNYGFSGFFDICRTTLDQHAPGRKKYVRGNHMPNFYQNSVERNHETQ